MAADRLQVKRQRDRTSSFCIHNYFGVTAICFQISDFLKIEHLVIVADFKSDFCLSFFIFFYFSKYLIGLHRKKKTLLAATTH